MSHPTPEDLGQQFFGLFHLVRRLVDDAMSSAGLSLSRAKVLGVLGEHGPMKQAAVATFLGFAPRTITETLDALEREGLAVRSFDPNDRRARLVQITPAGATAWARAVAVKQDAMATIFGGLDPAQAAQLAELLTGLHTRLDSPREEAHV